MKFEIRGTNKYGNGVYALEKIKEGELIMLLDGEFINEKDCDERIEKGLLRNDDPLQIEDDKYLILDEKSIAFNHSCDPNAGLKDRSTLFALRDIEIDEEITYDYSTTVGPLNFSFTTMKNCLCGSKKCRSELGNVLTISAEQLDFYKRKGALQDYIIEALKNNK